MAAKAKQAAIEIMARECVANQVRMLNRVVTGIYDDAFRPLRLTTSQMVILALTAKHNQIRAAQLCRWLQIDASTLSRNIDRMRSNGWIEQAPTADQRSRPFRLTAAGESLLDDAILAWQRAQAKAARLLGTDGVALLKDIANTVRGNRSPQLRRRSHGTSGDPEAFPRPARTAAQEPNRRSARRGTVRDPAAAVH